MLVCSICGMIINEKNYNFNEDAFLSKNDVTEIKYCPFCGASKEFLIEDGKILSVDSKSLNKETLKVLDHAVKLELFNSEFYAEAAKMADKLQIKKTFESLSRIENFHAKVHQKIGGFKELPKLSKVSYQKYDSDDLLLDLARQKEEHAVKFYQTNKGVVKDDNILKIFDALIRVEEDHILLTGKKN